MAKVTPFVGQDDTTDKMRGVLWMCGKIRLNCRKAIYPNLDGQILTDHKTMVEPLPASRNQSRFRPFGAGRERQAEKNANQNTYGCRHSFLERSV